MKEAEFEVQPSCADVTVHNSISVAEARSAIQNQITPLRDQETVAIRSALGRYLACDCQSRLDVPSHTNSAMDGYALLGSDLPSEGVKSYEVIDTVTAGNISTKTVKTGQCMRIMTGGSMPAGTDTVVMQEQAQVMDDGTVRIDDRHRVGQNVRHIGEDIARDSVVFNEGRKLSAADVGVLASLGVAELRVKRRPRVAFFSTGDELRSMGDQLEEGQVYDSNRYTLYSMLTTAGAEVLDMGVIKDDKEALEEAFDRASKMADVVITSGGVSVGEADYTKEILERLGKMDFWSLAMKPGRPLTFGKIGNALFFGLPGNPVAVMLTYMQFVEPALRYFSSGEWPKLLLLKARSEAKLKKKPGRFEYVRGILSYDEQGDLTVRPSGTQGSGVLTSMSRSNCLVLLNEDLNVVEPGDTVTVQPYDVVL